MDEFEIVCKIIALVFIKAIERGVLGDIAHGCPLACQNAASQRRIRDKRDVQFGAGGGDSVREDSRFEKRKFYLDSCDRYDLGPSKIKSVWIP